MTKSKKHENYEILNLLGYGLAKFDYGFIKQFGFKTKTKFYQFIVNQKIAETSDTVKNRQDLFDHFFDNGRKGWWQKGDAYIHRKILIDSIFGDLNCLEYSNVIKLYISEKFNIKFDELSKSSPILKSRFKQLQETGLEAELFFLNNYQEISVFQNGIIQDARLFGDGYDFQVTANSNDYLAEIKGVRNKSGSVRLTSNEYEKAKEFKDNFFLIIVSNLNNLPKLTPLKNPINELKLATKEIVSRQVYYQSQSLEW